jgi:osmotically-inducible protein OsmY
MTTKGANMSDHDLELSVTDELVWDPKVDAAAIAVSADHGTITLRGTVGSHRQKREAKRAAERVYGVTKVDNELEVRLLNGAKRETAELRGDVLRALELDSLVPATIDANVDDGFVTLTGTAEWQFQRDEAEFVASNVFGVVGVIDDVQLVGPYPIAGDVKHAIKDAFKRNARLDAEDISVSTFDGTVALEGTVGSWAEHDEAVAAAWAAPGATNVDDRISVEY